MEMNRLPREVHKWLQSLDLSFPVRNIRRDFSNGYLIAEIFSWYHPQEIQMHSYANGISLQTKLGNWSQLERFFQQKEFDIPKEIIDGAIHCKPRAASLLMEKMYTVLTNRIVKDVCTDGDLDFTDTSYQTQLPAHARSTASMAIKNNIATTELITEPDIIGCRQKAQAIINSHVEHRRQERVEDPRRFRIKPTLGQLCPRKAPPPDYETTTEQASPRDGEQEQEFPQEANFPFREIEVNQLEKRDHSVSLPPVASSGVYSMVH